MKCKVMFILFSTLVSVTLSCEIGCTKEMNPICATDGINFEMFSNECLMDNQKCRDGKSWTKSNVKSCSDRFNSAEEETVPCLKPCPLIASPICGFNGENYKLFSNTCSMQNGNCLLKNGDKLYKSAALSMCTEKNILPTEHSSIDSSCADGCPALYKPICGYNGNEYKLFGNSCVMGALICIRSETWQAVSLDLCPSIAEI